MIKKKILITAGSAVLFGCIIFATVNISGCNGSLHNSSNTISTTQVSESISIRDEGTPEGTTQPDTSTETTAREELTTQDATTVVIQPPTTNTPTTQQSTTEQQTTQQPTTQQQSTTDVTTTEEATTTLPTTNVSESTTEHITDKQNVTTTVVTKPETDAPTTEAPTVDINSEDSAVFSFTKIIVDKPDFDYYTKLVKDKGYTDIKSVEELSELSRNILTLKNGKKQVKYIITSKGLFDDIAVEMDVLKSKSENEPSFYNFNKRDRFLYDTLDLDYQKYYSNGVALFMLKKVQDIENNAGSNSVYAIYYYAYNTYEQLALQKEAINKAIESFTGTDYDKVYAAHEYVRSRVKYIDNGSYLVQTAYGALINKEAVCEGYAKAYKLLLNAMGIECDVVINAEHAWNVVKLDGEWYLVDVTNDDTNNGLMYFLLGKDVLMGDNDIARYFGYIDGSNTDVRNLTDIGYIPTVVE